MTYPKKPIDGVRIIGENSVEELFTWTDAEYSIEKLFTWMDAEYTIHDDIKIQTGG